MTTIDRSALRAELRARRRALDARSRMQAGEAVAARLRPLLGEGYVAGYWAVDGELPLHALLAGERRFIYCLPRLLDGNRLGFAPWRPGDALVANRFGIPEPDVEPTSLLDAEQLHTVLLPLVGFTRSGQRLGAGGGYYDRSFAARLQSPGAGPRLIGIGYACQQIEALDAQAWDVPLDAVVTELELIDLRPAAAGGQWDL